MAAWDDKQCSHVKRVVIIPRVCVGVQLCNVKRVVMISWEGRSLIEHMSNMHYAVTLY